MHALEQLNSDLSATGARVIPAYMYVVGVYVTGWTNLYIYSWA